MGQGCCIVGIERRETKVTAVTARGDPKFCYQEAR
jgi:hypothetical protein